MRTEFSPTRTRNLPLSQLCLHFAPSRDARRLLQPDSTVAQQLQAFCNNALWFDAVQLLAHLLHKRAAIWWAWLVCAELQTRAEIHQDAVLVAVQRWLHEPTDTHRMQVQQGASACDNRDPRYWLALAVHWCTADVSTDTDAPAVTPFLYARGVAAAIDIAAAQKNATKAREDFYREILQRGIIIAAGDSDRTAVKSQPARTWT